MPLRRHRMAEDLTMNQKERTRLGIMESILPLPRTATVCEAPVAETAEFPVISVLARLTLTYEVPTGGAVARYPRHHARDQKKVCFGTPHVSAVPRKVYSCAPMFYLCTIARFLFFALDSSAKRTLNARTFF